VNRGEALAPRHAGCREWRASHAAAGVAPMVPEIRRMAERMAAALTDKAVTNRERRVTPVRVTRFSARV